MQISNIHADQQERVQENSRSEVPCSASKKRKKFTKTFENYGSINFHNYSTLDDASPVEGTSLQESHQYSVIDPKRSSRHLKPKKSSKNHIYSWSALDDQKLLEGIRKCNYYYQIKWSYIAYLFFNNTKEASQCSSRWFNFWVAKKRCDLTKIKSIIGPIQVIENPEQPRDRIVIVTAIPTVKE
jgi:hypothetical protein